MRLREITTVLLLGSAAASAELAPLPEPLSLDNALTLSATDTPLLRRAEAGLQSALAGTLSADALDAPTLTARARLRAVEPSYKSLNPDHNDSSASLALRKRLWDGGHSEARQKAAAHGEVASRHRQLHARQQQHLLIRQAFYEVLLADLEFARDSEAMSVAFIGADRARDRAELGMISDVELLDKEAEYQEVLRQRFASESRQRLTRSKLALAMGRPNDLASDLISPEIELPEKKPQEFDAFWQKVLDSNPELLALRADLQARREQLESARQSNGPVLTAELDAAVYNRKTGSTHPLSAGLLLEVPLMDGGRKDAELARARSALYDTEAGLRDAELRLRQEALTLWLRRDTLRADITAFQTQADFRDLYLDRSRALYELEVKTDLGDAMTQTSVVRLNLSAGLFEWDMTQAKMQALVGELLSESK